MKRFLTLLTVLAVCLCLVQSTLAWNPPKSNDRHECFKRNKNVGNAIESFCWKNKDMVVPSAKAREGMWSKEGRFSVWIKGKCKPAQWVPMDYCFKNFWNMCVNMNKNDVGRANYGNGGCQTWHIKQF